MTSDYSTRISDAMPAEGQADSIFDPFDLFDDGHPGAIRFERMIETDPGAGNEGLSCSAEVQGDSKR